MIYPENEIHSITLCLQNGKKVNYYGETVEACHGVRRIMKSHMEKLKAKFPLAGYYLSKGYVKSAAKVMEMM